MENKTSWNTVFKIICVLLVLAMMYKALGTYFYSHTVAVVHKVFGSTSSKQSLHNSSATVIDILIQQRNNLSRMLNQKQQDIGQMECRNLQETNRHKPKVTNAGGFCPIASKTKHFGYDYNLAVALAHFFKGKSVGSFGDGTGEYKKTIMRTGLTKVYHAYDGAPNSYSLSGGRVRFLDLTLPQFGLPVYDWIVCLEVAEHIPKQFENIMLDNIKRHACEGVVLSWARPKQEGYSHVNNRSPKYVVSKMEKLGFKYNIEKTERLRKSTKLIHLRRNLNVFIRNPELIGTNLVVYA